MKVFSEESALQLSEMLLQNDKDIKTEIEGKIPSVEGLASREYVSSEIAKAVLAGNDVDLSAYATNSSVDEKISSINTGVLTISVNGENISLDRNGNINLDMSTYQTSMEFETSDINFSTEY